ncbi:type II secretion system protein GspM [Rhizobium terrae]|uniref:type II secretion system protein GspM n=1 Tax=Rhizobium terrae TaxID=2171756 RepID=UPI000E3DA02C|nr:type II secretion system protein GspM [Rhizobium terrae]
MRMAPLWRDTRLQSLVVIALLVVGALVAVVDTLLFLRTEARALSLYEERTALLESKASMSQLPQSAKQALEPGEGKILLEAQTRGLVSATFQRLLSNRVERAGAVIRRIDVAADGQVTNIDDPQLQSLERIRLTADIEVMQQSLPDLMYAIEAGSPVMVVDSFTLRLNRKVGISEADQTSSFMDRPLSLNVTLSAFREKGADS